MTVTIDGVTYSIRNSILDNVITTLQAIKTTAGYNTDIYEISRQFRPPQQSTIPALYIIAGDESITYYAQRAVSEFQVIITGYVQSETQLSILQEKLISDVYNAMVVDPGRGTNTETGEPNALDTRISAIRTYKQFMSPIGIFDAYFIISYPSFESAR